MLVIQLGPVSHKLVEPAVGLLGVSQPEVSHRQEDPILRQTRPVPKLNPLIQPMDRLLELPRAVQAGTEGVQGIGLLGRGLRIDGDLG